MYCCTSWQVLWTSASYCIAPVHQAPRTTCNGIMTSCTYVLELLVHTPVHYCCLLHHLVELLRLYLVPSIDYWLHGTTTCGALRTARKIACTISRNDEQKCLGSPACCCMHPEEAPHISMYVLRVYTRYTLVEIQFFFSFTFLRVWSFKNAPKGANKWIGSLLTYH